MRNQLPAHFMLTVEVQHVGFVTFVSLQRCPPLARLNSLNTHTVCPQRRCTCIVHVPLSPSPPIRSIEHNARKSGLPKCQNSACGMWPCGRTVIPPNLVLASGANAKATQCDCKAWCIASRHVSIQMLRSADLRTQSPRRQPETPGWARVGE